MSDEPIENDFIEQDKENDEQVGELIDTYHALDTVPENTEIIEAGTDLKQSLSSFVNHFLDRIRGHKEIEDVLKEALIERLPEASFDEIKDLLNIVLTKTNSAIEKVMIPFSGKDRGGGDGGTTNNFLFETTHKQPVEDKILKDEGMTPETIKGLYELAQLMNAITKK